MRDSKRLHSGAMLTEFESKNFAANDGNAHFDDVANTADANLLSWAFWEYKVIFFFFFIFLKEFYNLGFLYRELFY
jgi:hypothetical protein